MPWPVETIRDLITQAETSGRSEAKLSSPREAELFRFAIKNYKRRHKAGQELMTKVVGDRVILQKKPTVVILTPSSGEAAQ